VTGVVEQVKAIARRAAEPEGGSMQGEPHVEVRLDGDRVTFVFDFVIWHNTQSGSTWNYHYVVSGTARLVDRALAEVTTKEELCRHVTEHEMDWADPPYDTRAVFREIAREQLVASLVRGFRLRGLDHDQLLRAWMAQAGLRRHQPVPKKRDGGGGTPPHRR